MTNFTVKLDQHHDITFVQNLIRIDNENVLGTLTNTYKQCLASV